MARFDGGSISSDGGGLLLGQTEQATGIIRGFASCFIDHRDPELIEHTVKNLVAQRVYGLALGHEDLKDHDRLRYDPLLATLVGKADPMGQDRGKALVGKSTLNRKDPRKENLVGGEHRFFMESLKTKRNLKSALNDAYKALEIVIAADQSIRTGQVVRIK